MGVQRLAPEELFRPTAYSQVVVATGRRMVFVSGQVSIDAEGALVAPGDFTGQAMQVYANLHAALEAADVVKLTTYVVDYKPELRPLLAAARSAIFDPPALP